MEETEGVEEAWLWKKKRFTRFFDVRRGWVPKKKDEWFFHMGPIYRFKIWFYIL
jgi:hypothetical protein